MGASEMPNRARGEVALEIGGEVRSICLTLGALAQIEAAFGCRKLSELDARMRALSAADLLIVLRAMLNGAEVHAEDVAPGAAARAVAEAFRLGLSE
jgi:hypothetical protein